MRTLWRILLLVALLSSPAWAQTQGGGGGGGTATSVKINDSAGVNQLAVSAAGAASVVCTSGCTGSSPTDTVGSTISLNGSGVTASVATAGQNGVEFFLAAGTLTATITPEISLDAGTTWATAVFADPVTGVMQPTLVVTNPNTATQLTILYPGAITTARVRVSAFTSGAASGTLRGVITRPAVSLYGTDGASLRELRSTVGGLLKIDLSGTAANGTALLVTGTGGTFPVSGNLTGNQAVNVAQFAGANAVTGTGASGAGIPRVTVANDSTVILGTGAATIGALTANQSVNVAQVNGVTTQTGTGTAGTGTQRVAVASDSSITANAGTNLNTSALALDTSVNGLLLSQGSTTSGQKGPVMQAAVTTSPPTYTTATTAPISQDTAGNLRTNCVVGCTAATDQTTASASINAASGNGQTYPNGPAPSGIPLTGTNGAAVSVAGGGNLVANLTPQCSDDGGTTYYNGLIQTVDTGVVTSVVSVSSPAATSWQIICPQGSSHAQIKATSYTSGSSAFTGRGTAVAWPMWLAPVSTSAPSLTNGTMNQASLTTAGALRVDGSGVTQPVSGSGNFTVVQGTGTNLHIVCDSGCTAGGAFADNSAFTAGTTGIANIGGVFNDGLAAVTSGNAAAPRITNNRALHINLRNASGTEMGTSANPLFDNVSQIGGTGVVTGGTAGLLAVAGPTASGVTQTGNPIKTGGVFNTTQPTVTTGQIVDLQATARGALIIASGVDAIAVTPAANSAVNVAQVNGVTTSTGVGAAGTGTQRIVDVASGTTGSAVPTQASYVGANSSGNLTGLIACDNWTAISQTAGAQLFTGTSAKKTYICSINLVTATAQNVALVGGTGTVCATGTHAIAGGTTAATGWNLAANGGVAQGAGVGVIMQASTAADNVCLLQSGAGQVSGAISWTQF